MMPSYVTGSTIYVHGAGTKRMLKIMMAGAMMFLPTLAIADNTIVTPSGYTMSSGYNLQLYQAVSEKPHSIVLADAATNNIQFESATITRPGVSRLSLSAQALVLPETFVTPALSIGVKDITNSTGAFASDGYYGRGYYVAITKSLDNDLDPPRIKGILLTAGVGGGAYHGLFGGVGVDLPLRLAGTAEFDSRRMNYRVSAPIGSHSSFSYEKIGGQNWLGFDIHSQVSL
jgi:hypothetical protein